MVKRNVLSRPAAWVTVLVPIASYAQNAAQTSNWDCTGAWHMMHGSGWAFWWVFPILMIVVMVAACVFMMRFVMGHGHSHRNDTSSAVQLLNERFARGEIPKEEYEDKRATLARPR